MFSTQPTSSPVLNRLRLRWAVFLLLCSLSLAGGYVFLRTAWQPAYAVRWLALAALLLGYLLVVFWRGLSYNHRAGEDTLLPALGWGNNLTLLRGVLVAGLAGFLFSPQPAGWLAWVPGILYTLADMSDFFDGYLARRTNHATRLGEILDMSFDGLGVLAAAALAVQYQQLPAWYLLVALARYLFLAGAWLRRRLGKTLYDLPPSITRRILAGLNMGFIAVMLWPLFTPPGTHIAAAFFGLPFLLGFLRDWLYASGVLRHAQTTPRNWLAALQRWLPFALRLLILVLAGGMLLQGFRTYPALGNWFLVLISIEALVLLMLVLGIASRINAILALCLLGFHQMFASLSSVQIVLAAAYTAILFMGSGALSMWAFDESLFTRRAGDKRTHTRLALGQE